ncbi:hypothetical protein [Psychrobacter sp.]|uniref:hypothetical protein n=1 Tax=Psychrobacter sp. TaxID=56811 RepID=UPI0035623164
MPLRPIDAIFVHPKRRLYVVYYRGALWQLPRMKIDDQSWQNRQPYKDDSRGLYLSIHQAISDPILAQKLRTLNLPIAVRGSTLSRFEAWWEVHGFEWLKDKLKAGQSPLAAHQAATKTIDNQPSSPSNYLSALVSNDTNAHQEQETIAITQETTDVFSDMLADLADEVLHQPR